MKIIKPFSANAQECFLAKNALFPVFSGVSFYTPALAKSYGRQIWTAYTVIYLIFLVFRGNIVLFTAKENGLDPYWYPRYLFTKLPDAKTEEDLRKLLPTELDPEEIKGV